MLFLLVFFFSRRKFSAIGKQYFVYIVTNRPRGVLHTGVTGDLGERSLAHTAGGGSKFAKRYNCDTLVYAEAFDYIDDAIAQEKRLKRWRRDWKIALIEKANPDWREIEI